MTTTINPNYRPKAGTLSRSPAPTDEDGALDFQDTPPSPPSRRAEPTFVIHALLDDFPIEVRISGTAETLKATVGRLREIGATPPTPAARQAAQAERAREAPICTCDECSRYGKPMKESSKNQGTWYCPGQTGTKAGQPVYCKERA
jgi:hypothetical protein